MRRIQDCLIAMCPFYLTFRFHLETQTQRTNLWIPMGNGGGVVNWEIEIDMHTHTHTRVCACIQIYVYFNTLLILCIKWWEPTV